MCKYEVFLGGSCNPTTWRTEIAIPNLKKMGITYFNPQVSQWKPDLLETEHNAKENATVMFFVIDNQTRGISTLVEAAHIAASKRKQLILVIQSYTVEKQTISGEFISQEEYEDLRNGQEVLRDLVEYQGIPVFSDIRLALKCTEKILKDNVTVQELESDSGLTASRDFLRKTTIQLREAFNALVTSESGDLDLEEACLAFQLLKNESLSVGRARHFLEISGVKNGDIRVEDEKIGFEQFRSLEANLTRLRQKIEEPSQEPNSDLFSVSPRNRRLGPVRDVFLSGTDGDASWKENIAVPVLRKNGLSYFNPRVSEWSKRFLPIEAAAMNHSYVLLFVIVNSARSVAEMAVAGYYIGLGANMVLCVEHLPDDAIIGGDKLSETAVKDYKRGRMYLVDTAKRHGVPVFNDIAEAVNCIVEQCKQR